MPFDQTNFVEAKPEVELEPWRRVLLDAAQIVRKGWCQNAIERGGKYCAIGALYVASGNPAISGVLKGPAMRAFGELWDSVGRIDEWNNAPGRTAEEVAAAMEECARQP